MTANDLPRFGLSPNHKEYRNKIENISLSNVFLIPNWQGFGYGNERPEEGGPPAITNKRDLERLRREIIQGACCLAKSSGSKCSGPDTFGAPRAGAMNRLFPPKGVSPHEQRDFASTAGHADELLELTRTPVLINDVALRESTHARWRSDWEEPVLRHFQSPVAYIRRVEKSRMNPDCSECCNRCFQAALLAGCGSRLADGFQ